MGDVARVARGFKWVRLIGWPLLGLSLLALSVSGWWPVHLVGRPLGQSWLLFGACLYPLGCIFWLVFTGHLARVQRQAGIAETAGVALSEQTLREIKVGLVMIPLGAASFIAVVVPMVSKPS